MLYRKKKDEIRREKEALTLLSCLLDLRFNARERGQWEKFIQFRISCVGFTVSLSNFLAEQMELSSVCDSTKQT
jgi:hypothetical protein